MSATAASTFFSRAALGIPVCFLAGFALKDYRDSAIAEEQWVARRVAQRLGTWEPPPLQPAEREVLVIERDAILSELARLDARRRT